MIIFPVVVVRKSNGSKMAVEKERTAENCMHG